MGRLTVNAVAQGRGRKDKMRIEKRGMPRRLERIVGRFMPNFKSAWLQWRFSGNPFGDGYRQDIHITPALIWTPWQKSVLATIKDLGITTYAGSIGLEIWTWKIILSYGLSRQR